MAIQVLVVEDESEIRELICLQMLRQGFLVSAVGTAEEALDLIEKTNFDCFILDWMLPHLSGLDVLKIVKSKFPDKPVLMVTAKAEAENIVEGLESGADDYITKPFETAILNARIKSLIRRSQLVGQKSSSVNSALIEVGSLLINKETYEVKCGNEVLHLTPSEFKLLLVMVENQGKVLTRDRLVHVVQGEGISVVGRTIDTHVFGLRKKMGQCSDFIETIRGVGYRIRVI